MTEGYLLPLAAGVSRVEKSRSFRKCVSLTTAATGDAIAQNTPPVFQSENLSLRTLLRNATAPDHEIVDAAFGRFDLTSPASYTAFLSVHAQVLGPLEAAVDDLWEPSSARFALLEADLADLKTPVIHGEPVILGSDATRWGVMYVLEGSRLGGGLLAKRVAEGLPKRYLSAAHEGGSWRRFGDALDAEGATKDAAWHDDVVAGAKLAFSIFADAAGSPS